MHKDLAYVLLSEEEIQKRVRELAEQINQDYAGKELVLIGILKGAVVFFSDVMRALDLPVTIDFMAISSYGSATESAGVVRIMKDLDKDIMDKHVIVVEDIVDTGLTLSFLKENLLSRGAASLKICALLDKPDRRKAEIRADYQGFVIPDEFVVGYGLDYAERYRNLPYIGILKPEIYTKA